MTNCRRDRRSLKRICGGFREPEGHHAMRCALLGVLLALVAWAPMAPATTAETTGDAQPRVANDEALPAELGDVIRLLVDAGDPSPARAETLRVAARVAVRGGTDPSLLTEVLRRFHESGLGEAEASEMVRRMRRLAQQGLPGDPVLDRYLQGMAKQVPLDRIRTVSDRIEANLDESARALESIYPETGSPAPRTARFAMIDHGAYGLGVGLPAEGLRAALMVAASDGVALEEARGPVLAAACMVAGGIPPARSLDVVRLAWKCGYRGTELEQLGQSLGGLGEPGRGPDPSVLDDVMSQMRRDQAHESLFRLLEDLRLRGQQHPPGMGPDSDPAQMRGPGGSPEDPGHQEQHGHGSGRGSGGGSGGR